MAEIEKLDPEFKKEWIAALRSREYKQGTDNLLIINATTEDAYCCLGVACKIAGVSGGEMHKYSQIAPTLGKDYPLLKPLSFEINVEVLEGSKEELILKLMGMNDGTQKEDKKQYTFLEIADYIEEHL